MKTFGFDDARRYLEFGKRVGIRSHPGNSYYISTGINLVHKTQDGVPIETLGAYPFDWPDRTDFYLYKKVTFTKAWDHLIAGKSVSKDGITYRLGRHNGKDYIYHYVSAGGDIEKGYHEEEYCIPIDWIDATDFELVED